jgi:glucose 1-dehydrogenase
VPNSYENDSGGRVAVITGSGKGIGKAAATEFAKAGYSVMINDLGQEDELKSTVEEISKIIGYGSSNKIAYVLGDVSREDVSVSLIDQTVRNFGRIDVLINNAGIAEKWQQKKQNEIPTTATNSYYKQVSPYFTLEEYEIADTNLRSSYLCIREAVKRMIEAEKEAEKVAMGAGKRSSSYSIINISTPYESIPKQEAESYTLSMSGVDPFTSSRTGVKTLTKTVALQLADMGIRVNAIVPGLIATNVENKRILRSKENGGKEIPFHRIGQPEEIAKIALFLASDDASYITGSTIYADGGISLLHSNYFLESEIEKD